MTRFLAVAAVVLVALCLPIRDASAYGALAVTTRSDSSNYYMTWNYSTQATADAQALTKCSGPCKIQLRFHRQCAAIATGENGGAGWAVSSSKISATTTALANCRHYTTNCKARTSACDTK